jgi:hypothetical protein
MWLLGYFIFHSRKFISALLHTKPSIQVDLMVIFSGKAVGEMGV